MEESFKPMISCPSCKGTKDGTHLEQTGKHSYHCHYCGADFVDTGHKPPEKIKDYLTINGTKWVIGYTQYGKYTPCNRELIESYLATFQGGCICSLIHKD